MFIAFITSSSVAMVLTTRSKWSKSEQRSLALPPALPINLTGITSFFTATDEYLNDHFGFREFYIKSYQQELDNYFDKTSATSLVFKGLNGWYFLDDFSRLDDFFGLDPLTQRQIRTWVAIQNKKNYWLQERGIHYLSVIVPNKQAIYSEYLMENAEVLKGTSRFEQLLEFYDNQLPEYMVNLHEFFRTEASDKSLYYKNDSHWNWLGSYLAFQKMFEKISTWFPDEEFITEYEFQEDETGIGGNNGRGGDLANLLMQPFLTETYPQIKRFKHCGEISLLPYPLSDIVQSPGRKSFISKGCPQKKLKAVIFRDSFFVSLEPFFSQNFDEIVYLWKEYDQQNIEEILAFFKPDIVVEAIVERHVFDSFLKRKKQPPPTVPQQ